MSINIDKAKLKEELDILPIHKLTLLNARSALAFTVAVNANWVEYDFGDKVPVNTILALCMLNCTTVSDIMFRKPGGNETSISWGLGGVSYSMGQDINNFDGAVFAYVPVLNRKTRARNAGAASCAVPVYVVGYITEEVDGNGFYHVPFKEDIQCITNGTAVAWTDIDIHLLIAQGGIGYYDVGGDGMRLIGLYIALDCVTDQNVYFRKKGSSEAGVLWEPDTKDPGTHLIGFIPIDYDGIFQYYTSAGNAVNVYVEGLLFEAPGHLSDKIVLPFQIFSSLTIGSVWSEPAGAGCNFIRHAKAIITVPGISPGNVNTFKVRPKGGTNLQIFYKKSSCGQFSILTPIGNNGTFEYWSDGTDNSREIRIGSIIIVGH